ncbi:hypothetical protein AAMO2058_000274100 [Amorphochlora amoebiformis]
MLAETRPEHPKPKGIAVDLRRKDLLISDLIISASPGLAIMEGYKKISKLGEGASGVVFKAEVLDLSRIEVTSRKRLRQGEGGKLTVAIKKIKLKSNKEGLSQEAVREIKVLQELAHPNVVKILDIFKHHANINLVMELMETDLENVIKDTKNFVLQRGDVKSYMKMLLEAIKHCHDRWILHRDVKPGNCLIAHDGSMHLTDFGLAKAYGSPERKMTPGACTIWYRAPEMLFNADSYGSAIDMWAVGCVFGELMTRRPVFPGEGELNQLSKIFGKLGTPTEEEWSERKNLPQSMMYNYEETKAEPWEVLFPAADPVARDLIMNLLRFNPNKRLTAGQALEHRYFKTAPAPSKLENMPTVRKRRR